MEIHDRKRIEEKNAEAKKHLEVVGNIIARISYYSGNLKYIISQVNEEEKKDYYSYPFLTSIGPVLWSIIILDLYKLLSESSQDKFRIKKLINHLLEFHRFIEWHHKIEKAELEIIKSQLSNIQLTVKKLKEIRDCKVAHFDDKNIDYKLNFSELLGLLQECQCLFNKINFAINNATTLWHFSQSEMIVPLIKNLNKYSKIREIYFNSKVHLKSEIAFSELAEVFCPDKV